MSLVAVSQAYFFSLDREAVETNDVNKFIPQMKLIVDSVGTRASAAGKLRAIVENVISSAYRV